MADPDQSLGDRLLASPTVQTLIAFVLVFVAMRVLSFAFAPLAGLFVLSTPVTLQPWTLVTSVYSHGSIGHLVSNSIALLLVGIPLERATKGWAYHAFFVITGAIAGLSQVWAVQLLSWITAALDVLVGWAVAVPTVQGHVGVLGASGAIFAMFGYVVTGNRFSAIAFERFRIPQWAQIAAFVVVAVVLTLWTASPGVALVAHFTGLLVGLLAGRIGILPTARSGSTGRDEPRPA